MNLVVIVLDTFRADIIGPDQRLSFVDTPNLDRFAEESITFDNAYGEAQPTLQIRRALYTGRRSFPWRYNYDRRGHWHHAPGWHKIPPEHDTIAEILSARGYLTGLIADVYHMFKPTMNYWRGFTSYEFIRGQESDNYRGGTVDSIRDRMLRHVREPVDISRHGTLIQYLLNMRDRKSEEDYLCAQVMNRACRWLDDHVDASPFMLWVEAFDPHEPWDPPASYADAYCPNYDGKDFIMPGAGHERGPMTDTEKERTKALYFGEVTFLDSWVGKLLDKIDSLGLRDDTIVCVLSDHGTQILDKGRFGKGAGQMHPFNTRMVWHMRHPDGGAGTHITPFVQSHDFMPTCLDLLNVPFETDGTSVWPLVTGKASSIRDTIVNAWAEFSEGNATARVSVRNKDWNFVHAVGRTDDNPELYDLRKDADETSNIIGDHPDVAAELAAHIERLIGSPLPGVMNEVCDPSTAPIAALLKREISRLT